MRNLRNPFTCFYGILGELEKKAHIYMITNPKVSIKPIFIKNKHTCTPICNSSSSFNLRLANYFQPHSNIKKKSEILPYAMVLYFHSYKSGHFSGITLLKRSKRTYACANALTQIPIFEA